MNLKPNGLVLIVLTITLYSRGSSLAKDNNSNTEDASSPPDAITILKTGPKDLDHRCLTLPSISKPRFELLIRNECYVDKTRYLEKLIQRDEIFFFLSRPKRLGKTLLIDTMEMLFSGKKYRYLFWDTIIYKKLFYRWIDYPIIRIDFTDGISTDSASSFNTSLLEELKAQAKLHNITLERTTIEGVVKEFILALSEKFDSPIVILVDEYDSPYTASYTRDKGEALKILKTLQSFLGALKGRYKNIHFCFVTGVTRLDLPDFFSGSHADAINLSMDSEYAGIVGFSETELYQYFGDEIKKVARECGRKVEDMVHEMRKWYDGFRFGEKDETLYSPCSVVDYLKSKTISISSWSNTGGPSQFLVERLKELPVEALQLIANDGIDSQMDELKKIENPLRVEKWVLDGKMNFTQTSDPRALVALLFHNGYLRVASHEKEYNTFVLEFTNLELKEDYAWRLYYSLTNSFPTTLVRAMDLTIRDLDQHKWQQFIETLNTCCSRIPIPLLLANKRKAFEAWLRFTMFTMFHFSKYARRYETPIMEDITYRGRADIVFFKDTTTFIIEFKMAQNPENAVYECKKKYLPKYLINSKNNIVCIGLKFLPEGQVDTWGVATFTKEGRLLQEVGNIKLTTKIRIEEEEEIIARVNHTINCALQPYLIIRFLEQIGPTTKDELVLAREITEDIDTLCRILREIEPLLKPNLKGIIGSFLKRVADSNKDI